MALGHGTPSQVDAFSIHKADPRASLAFVLVLSFSGSYHERRPLTLAVAVPDE